MRPVRSLLLTVAVVVLAGCGPSKQEKADEAAAKAAEAARSEMQGRDYEEVLGASGCTGDCAGHNAGFAYAQENGIEGPSTECEDHGDSFDEGCAAYGQVIDQCVEAAREAVMQNKDPAGHCPG